MNVVAENEEERKIENYINLLHESDEVKNFLVSMNEEANKRNVYKYRARIKSVESAIRTYRINNKKLEDVHDYVGISFITNTEDEIYPIVDYLHGRLQNKEDIDFVDEKYIYSPLVYTKWVPPLGYDIFAKEDLMTSQREVPIEIRVCSKEGFISEQSAYYSVQKNDTITMPIEEKNQLRNVVQHITYKFALLNMRNFTDEERKKQEDELNSLIKNNEDFLRKNIELYKDAILDCGRLIYRVEYDDEMTKDEKNLEQDEIDAIDQYLKDKFCSLLENQETDRISRFHNAIEQMRLIDYKDIKNYLKVMQ